VVEFVVLGTVLLVPVIYLVLVLGRVQAGSYAVDGAARAAARAFTAAADEATGRARARAAVRLGLLDQGFDADADSATRIDCSDTPCLTPQSTVSVQVSVDVMLPGVPTFVDAVVPTHVVVRSTQVAVVDAFRARTVA
jgi:hypothetical protein